MLTADLSEGGEKEREREIDYRVPEHVERATIYRSDVDAISDPNSVSANQSLHAVVSTWQQSPQFGLPDRFRVAASPPVKVSDRMIITELTKTYSSHLNLPNGNPTQRTYTQVPPVCGLEAIDEHAFG